MFTPRNILRPVLESAKSNSTSRRRRHGTEFQAGAWLLAARSSAFRLLVSFVGHFRPALVAVLSMSGGMALALDLDPRLVGTWNESGPDNRAQDVAVVSNHVYMAHGEAGLQVIDISDRAAPRRIGHAATTGEMRGLAVVTNHVFVADGFFFSGRVGEGLVIFNVSDPADPQRLAAYDTPGEAQDVAIDGQFAYVADGAEGLQVIDISDRSNPRWLGSYDTSGFAEGVVVSGNYAYVADGFSGMQVIDVSNPVNPRKVGGYGMTNEIRTMTVAVSGRYAYVGQESWRLEVVDISDPANPQGVSTYQTNGRSKGLAIAGNYAYLLTLQSCQLACWGGGLEFIDITDPADPRPAGYVHTSGIGHGGVAVAGNHAYVADDYTGLKVIDIAPPANPQPANNFHPGSEIRGPIVIVETSDEYAYIVEQRLDLQGYEAMITNRLHVLDIRDVERPQLLGSLDLSSFWLDPDDLTGPKSIVDLVAREHCLFVADGENGLKIIDTSDPTNPRLTGSLDTAGQASGVALSGNYAFVADGYRYWRGNGEGLVAIDVSDPTNPQRVSSLATIGDAVDIVVKGSHAYVAGKEGGLQVIDISDPENPRLVCTYPAGGYDYHMAMFDGYVYLLVDLDLNLTFRFGISVLDARNPEDLFRVGGNKALAGGADIAVTNNRILVAAGGLSIFYPYQPILFEDISRADGGEVSLRVSGPPDVPGRIQRSANLKEWEDWQSLTFGEDPMDFSDPDAATVARRFYRIAVP